jgi:hypothetical protein
MKSKHLLSLMLVILITIPMSGWGQALFDITAVKHDPSRLFPILSSTDIVGAPDSPIQIDAIKKISDRCRSRVPARFPPEALDDYCACAAAATQGTVTVGELRELQKETNRKLGNATFEKYVKNVMKPCMEIPIEDVEYMMCITSRDVDWRIKYPVPFCKCTSRGIRDHFQKFGLEEMMISWGTPNQIGDEDPTTTLWDNPTFLKNRVIEKKQCVGRYMDIQNLR